MAAKPVRERNGSRDSGFEDVDFLLPNGFMVSLNCDRRSSLSEIKSVLWGKVVQLPAANLLRDSVHYVFIGVTKQAVEEELDENLKIEDLHHLAKPILEVSVAKLTRDLNLLKHKIGEVIGTSIQTLDNLSNKRSEFKDVRHSLKQMCHPIAKEREAWSREQKALYFFPPKFDRNEDLPACTARKIMKHPEQKLRLKVLFPGVDGSVYYNVDVAAFESPRRVIEAVIETQYIEKEFEDDAIAEQKVKLGDNYALKVCGREEYMLKECCLHTYEYVRHCIDREETPDLQMVLRDNLLKSIPENKCVILQQDLPEPEVTEGPKSRISSWDVHSEYSIKIRSFPEKRRFQPGMFVRAQLFHGSQPLSKAMTTKQFSFNQPWRFDISVDSLPRCARLCLVACDTEKDTVKGINWVNVQVFDHTGKLKTGEHVVKVTNFPDNCNRTEYPLGTPGSNPDKGSNELRFEIMPPCGDEVYFPSSSDIDTILEREKQYYTSPKTQNKCFELISRICHEDPLKDMSRGEKEFLWQHRYLAMEYQPNILPRVVQCVSWSERHHVFELYRLLKQLPVQELSLVTALQLLGPDYPDTRVRAIAVNVLERNLNSGLLQLYLPQLVQAVKLESYHDNELSRFLLCRALRNRNVGHRYFWHLRSELRNAMSKLRFAPLLEIFCLYCGSDALEHLHREVKALEKYRGFSELSKKEPNIEQQQQRLRCWLEEDDTRSVLENQTATLDQNVELGDICVKECKVMSSKMRPLWLTWNKRKPTCSTDKPETVKYIVKDGDDLRQDMLVMQLIRLMDMLWKYTSRDYCITSYECLSMDDHFGMIEVVGGAKTVCDIEMHKQMGVMATTSMHEWLYKESGGGEEYLEAVKRFTHSCAAFSVITYILGIGDRHSDNIMLKVTGQLFHIDFGHFMNHKKDKYGIKRERTPFVLTKDFITIVMKGDLKASMSSSEEFNNFLYLCLEAYMTIRRNGTLFLTLLSLMMYCDLPELQELADINYCRKCLALDKPEHEAANDFYEAIMAAYRGQWKTNIDWFLHRVNRVWTGMGSGS